MEKTTIQDYLLTSGMDKTQAEALSNILGEMVTRSHLRAELEQLRTDLEHLRADLTWKIIAIVGFFATVSTLLNIFAG